jgi:hypothetical protein
VLRGFSTAQNVCHLELSPDEQKSLLLWPASLSTWQMRQISLRHVLWSSVSQDSRKSSSASLANLALEEGDERLPQTLKLCIRSD